MSDYIIYFVVGVYGLYLAPLLADKSDKFGKVIVYLLGSVCLFTGAMIFLGEVLK